MKKLLITIIFLIPFLRASAPDGRAVLMIQASEVIEPYEKLWQAICFVESSHRPEIKVLDRNGKYSVGIAQIQKSRVDHYNQMTGSSYRLSDMHDPEISKKVFMFYAVPDFETTARKWNGGTKAMSKKSTLEYWNKVKKYL